MDKNGNKQELKIDDNGNPFYLNSDGKKVNVPKQTVAPIPEIFQDENGDPFVLDAKGNRQKVQIDSNGQPFYTGENGKPVLLSQQKMQNFQMVYKDENGLEYMVDKKNGKKV